MEYQTAKRYRNRSLLGLIGQRKLEEGQGFGRSIAGGVSDKFKAAATGIKEQLDPMNWVRQLTGKGALGDWATGAFGKLTGRSNRDIEYFGGFSGKKRRIRDPLVATISSSNKQQLQNNDSLANILGKIYNFMTKVKEDKTRQDEIDKSFRQEQLDEDEKRHQQLVKAIQGSRPTATKVEGEKGNSMFDNFMKEIKKLLEPILEIFNDIKSFIKSPVWEVLKSGWATIARSLAPFILPVLGIAAVAALIWAEFEAADYINKWWKEKEVEKAKELGGDVAAAAAKEQTEMPNYDPTDAEAGDKYSTLEAKKGVAIDKKNKLVAEYMQTKGFKEKKGISWNPFKDPNDKTYLDVKGNQAPPELKKEARQWADAKLVEQVKPKETATPVNIRPTMQNDPRMNTALTQAQKTTSEPSNTLAAKPVPKSAPNITPTPESTPVLSEPNVQVNNTTNNVGGKKPKTVTTSSVKQRNDDLDYYHQRITPAY